MGGRLRVWVLELGSRRQVFVELSGCEGTYSDGRVSWLSETESVGEIGKGVVSN